MAAILFSLSPIGSVHAAGPEDNDANIPVRDRSHPEWDARGIAYGSTFFYPSVTVAGEFDSNVFASSSPVDDFALVIAPELRIHKDASSSTHDFNIGARYYDYRRFNNEDRTEAHANLKSKRQFGSQIDLVTNFEAARKFEPRGDSLTAAGSVKPIAYNDLHAETVVTKTFNRFGLGVGADIRQLTYDDGTSSAGAPIDQSFRDGIIVAASLKPFYEFSPGYRAFARLEVNRRDYQGTGVLDRDSEGYAARGGIEFLITPMLFGSIEAGYLDQRYDNPATPGVEGLSLLSKLTWLMTPLMTVSLFASRSVAESAAQGPEARIDLTGGFQLDYEIRRNLTASLGSSFANEEFAGISRNDDVIKANAALDYSVNEYIHFNIKYSYTDRQSNISNFSFNDHKAMAGITAQY